MADNTSPWIALVRWIADNPQAPYYVMLFISSVFLGLLTWFLLTLNAGEQDVRRLTGVLSTGNAGTLALERSNAGERIADFFISQSSLNEKSPIARRLRHYFDGILPRTNLETRLRTSQSASDILEFDSLVRETLNLRLLQAIPNVLVGVGLLFTFLGLTAALYFASQGAGSTDVSQTQESIRRLLDAAAFKFSSSLIALLLSMVFLFTERIRLRIYQKHVLRLASTLDEAFPPSSTEELIASMLGGPQAEKNATAVVVAATNAIRESLDPEEGSISEQLQTYLGDVRSLEMEARNQTILLRNLGATIADAVSARLDATLGVRFSQSFDRLDETIDKIGRKIQKANEDALKRIVDEFIIRLERHTSQSFKQMVTASEAFSTTILSRVESVDTSFERLQSTTQLLSEEGRKGLVLLNDAAATINQLLEQVSEAGQGLYSTSQSFQEIFTTASAILSDLKKTQDKVTSGIGKVQKAAEAFEVATGRSYEASIETSRRFEEHLQKAILGFDACLSDLSSNVRNNFQSITADVDRTTQALRTLADTTSR